MESHLSERMKPMNPSAIREIFKTMLMSIYHVRVDYDLKKEKKAELPDA